MRDRATGKLNRKKILQWKKWSIRSLPLLALVILIVFGALLLGRLGLQQIAAASYNINASLRFATTSAPVLSRTPATAGNSTTWTASVWVKRGAITTGFHQDIMTAGADGSNYTSLGFTPSDQFHLDNVIGGVVAQRVSTAVFRDPAAWLHIVVAVDTTQAVAANRVRMYINNVEITSWSTDNPPAQSDATFFDKTNLHTIGRALTGIGISPYDGYMSDIYFVDGQQLTPSSFGISDSYSYWHPKKYTGTYGTNGFHLTFSNASNLGQDTSGVTQGFTKIFLTSGTTWTVPAGWDSASNTVEVIGGGGGGGSKLKATAFGGSGGGGGAYSKISNLALTPGASVNYQVGTAGSGASAGTGTNGTNGGDTYFNGTGSTCASQSVCAKGGSGSNGTTGGAGGVAGSGVGTTKNSGGAGGNGNTGAGATAGGGGGGAGGPNGAGGAGGTSAIGVNGGSGGGGNGGGTAGTNASTGNGSAGGNSSSGSGSGAGGTSSAVPGSVGTNGGGGGGGFSSAASGSSAGGSGSTGIDGSGSGGGGGGGTNAGTLGGNGGTGGLYGGGGGGGGYADTGAGGAGGQGVVALSYTPLNTDWTATNLTSADQVIDTPTNGFATYNSIAPNATTIGNLRNANLTATVGTSTMFMTTGKWYWEVTANTSSVVGGVTNMFGTSNNTVSVPTGLTYGFRFNADTGALDYTADGTSYTSLAIGLTGGRYAFATGASNSVNFGQLMTGPSLVASTTATRVFLTLGTSFTVPADWNSASNTVEVIGGGGGGTGGTFNVSFSSGGGGGAYSRISNLSLTPGASVAYSVGSAGAGGNQAVGTVGGDTYFCNSASNCASISGTAVVVGAKGGGVGNRGFTVTGGAGGAAGSGVGTTKFSGGNGAPVSAAGASGSGGGAAGPNGAGNNGQQTATTVDGGSGDAGFGGAGGSASGGPGAAGTEWTATAGGTAGSGGGGGVANNNPGGNGGLYGGGGGSSTSGSAIGGNGAQGIIILTYNGFLPISNTYYSSAGGYFKYNPSAGYKALSTGNLLIPIITQPAKYFNATTYIGNGSTQSVTTTQAFNRIFLTSGTSFTVPADWNSSNNTIEVIGGGGGASGSTSGTSRSSGGGGGAYSRISNLSLTPGASVAYSVGSAGAGGNQAVGTVGGDTYFCNSTSNCASISGSAVQVGAKGGAGGTRGTNVIGGVGGAAGSGVAIGTSPVKFSGGNGAPLATAGTWGSGGGAAGPNGAGNNGVQGNTGTLTGGSGDAGFGGAGGAITGGNGTEWDATHGSGGGGGGNATSPGGNAGLYGGGGGSSYNATSIGGNGSQGMVVISYTAAQAAVPTFQPDFVWLKDRSATNDNVLFDSVRAATNALISNLTNAEIASSTSLTSFNSNGFSLGTDGTVNSSGHNYVAWAWKEAPATDGFDIVSYTGDGASNRNIGHSLGASPDMVIVKNRTATGDWWTWHSGACTTSTASALDGSGNSHNGTLVGSPSCASGKIADALSFNGSSQYVTIGSLTSGTTISYSFWINPSTISASAKTILWDDNSAGGGDSWIELSSAGKIQTAGGFGSLTSTASIAPGVWTHVVVVADGTGKKIYINGSLDTSNGSTISSRTGISYVTLGASYDGSNTIGGGQYWLGSMDEVRVYSTALSSGDVSTLYNLGSVTSGLVGLWTFDPIAYELLNTTAVTSTTNSPWGAGNFSSTQFMVANNATNNANKGTPTTVTFLTSGTSFVVPSDWNPANNTIEVIGGGGGGGSANNNVDSGGGGGGYSKITNASISAGATVTIAVGAGGAANVAGGDTYLCNSTSNCASITGTAVIVGAKGGGRGAGTGSAGGAGGAAASGVGTVKNTGGNGGSSSPGMGGGGGAAGPNGNGNNGSNGTSPTSGIGGSGDAGFGGAGAAVVTTPGTAGSPGTEWDATHGSGGGGGACGTGTAAGGAGGLYGGGGGGACQQGGGAAGAGGIIVVTYTPAASNYIAYLFKNVPGFSAFGSYVGNGLADGPFINTGFKPKYILVKDITAGTGGWIIRDTAREPFNVSNINITPNGSGPEVPGSTAIDLLSNGFKNRGTGGGANASGVQFIYAAFADVPFKYSAAPAFFGQESILPAMEF